MCECEYKDQAKAWEAVSVQLTKGNKDWTNKAGTSIECAEWEIQRLQDLERDWDSTRQAFDRLVRQLRDEQAAVKLEARLHNETLKLLHKERGAIQRLQHVEASFDKTIAELRDTELALIGERNRHAETLKVLEEERKRAETKHPSDVTLAQHVDKVCEAYLKYNEGSHPEAVAHAVLWLLRRAEREG